ncbi:zinc finger CCCH domain-containing protein 48-like [Syzygium oleosum]|uniref:zinc finger CCCH domain-containing protein 48-like n=1 Tax=Syzygium oleosum TaxID=219896 RepID=UPI0024B8A41A|nr:zinc finger CCCH domain-containing protein 48-like [Syzygium oleosum]
MATAMPRSQNSQTRTPWSRGARPPTTYAEKTGVCHHWLAGHCSRDPCRFLHGGGGGDGGSRPEVRHHHYQRRSHAYHRVAQDDQDRRHGPREQQPQKQDKLCHRWTSGNDCARGENCRFLHSWSRGGEFSVVAQLHGHQEAVTGVGLPSGTGRLFSGSRDGTVRSWDCGTGACDGVFQVGREVGSLVTEGPWVFVGVPDTVKAFNASTAAEFSLAGVVGQVYAMIVGNSTLFAGAQDGSVLAWRMPPDSGAGDPFHFAGKLEGHRLAVISLMIGNGFLYSGSMDSTVRVWDTATLECVRTLEAHSGAVTSLLCWDRYLITASTDKKVKVWGQREDGQAGDLEPVYEREESHGVVRLFGMHDGGARPVVFCSCEDGAVRAYELPSFAERGRIFARKEVRDIQTGGDGGLFFTGDDSGAVTVWRWPEKENEPMSSA